MSGARHGQALPCRRALACGDLAAGVARLSGVCAGGGKATWQPKSLPAIVARFAVVRAAAAAPGPASDSSRAPS